MVRAIAMLPFVRVRAIFLLLACFSASVVSARDARGEGSSTSTGSTGETDDARFRRLKAEGDRALAERRLNDAIDAYDAALAIQRDPLVAGRTGLAMSFYSDPRAFEYAAGYLYEAVSDAAGTSSQEKDAFFAAYKRVRKQVCKVTVDTNDVNARIRFGEDLKDRHLSFFVFVKKGKGEAVGRLEGREDIRKTWDCTGDHDIALRFDFPPAAPTPAKTITVIKEAKEKPAKETVKIVHVPIPAMNSIPDSKGNRLGVLFGPSVVFGVAPSPAYGVSVSGTYKFERWSAMLGARGAYAFGPIEGNRIDVLAVTGLAGPCTTAQWFYVCGFAAVNVLRPIPDFVVPNDSDTMTKLAPGLGIGMGARYSLTPAIALYALGDAMILLNEVSLAIPTPNGVRTVWTGRQGLFSLSLGVSFGP